MTDLPLDRRSILKTLALLGATGAVLHLPDVPTADAAATTPTILGAWVVTVTTHGASAAGAPGAPSSPVISLHTFAMGTALMETSMIDRTPQPNPSTGPGLGIWIATGNGTFKKRWIKLYFDPFGNYVGYLDCRQTNTLDQVKGDTFTGTGTAKFHDITGKLLDSYTATEQGTRIQIDF